MSLLLGVGMRVGAQLLSPNLLEFTNFFTNPTKILKKTLSSAGGAKLWTKVLDKLNYYVRENTGEMSVL
jgi:hypothetical protein